MGRNGAGKSTLLRAAPGWSSRRAGRIEAPARVRAARPEPRRLPRPRAGRRRAARRGRPAALAAVGLAWAADADPRDLSGGERQRLALAIAMAGRGAEAGGPGPRLPRRADPRDGPRAQGRARGAGSRALRRARAGGRSSPPTTSSSPPRSPSASCCSASGEVIADGAGAEVLVGGWYFATEVARILGAAARSRPSRGRAASRAAPQRSEAADELAGRELRRSSALVIVGGFAWYERSRPPARIVALVAALAALAVAGRVAPRADPERRRDDRHRAAHRLRARRGARLRGRRARRRWSRTSGSGRGPGRRGRWPAGGWSGSAAPGSRSSTGRRLGRMGLAVACGVAGLAYGALLDLSVMVTYGGEQSLDRYLAFSARGHTVQHRPRGRQRRARAAPPGRRWCGCCSRFRDAVRVHGWRPARPRRRPLAALAVAACGVARRRSRGSPGRCWRRRRRRARDGDARRWLVARAERRRRLRRPSPGGASSPGDDRLGDARARGRRRATRSTSQRTASTPVDYLRATCGRRSIAPATSSGRSSRSTAPGSSARDFAGRDLVTELARAPAHGDGSFEGQVEPDRLRRSSPSRRGRSTARPRTRGDLAALGARTATAAGASSPARPSEPDSTGAVLQALARRRAAAGLDGGVALAARAPERRRRLVADRRRGPQLAVDRLGGPGADRRGRRSGGAIREGGSGLDYLAARQAADGHYRYSKRQRPDAGLGDRPGDHRGRARAVPARAGRRGAPAATEARPERAGDPARTGGRHAPSAGARSDGRGSRRGGRLRRLGVGGGGGGSAPERCRRRAAQTELRAEPGRPSGDASRPRGGSRPRRR